MSRNTWERNLDMAYDFISLSNDQQIKHILRNGCTDKSHKKKNRFNNCDFSKGATFLEITVLKSLHIITCLYEGIIDTNTS